MRIFFFLLFHTLSNVAKSPEPGVAQLVVALHCNSGVLGSNPAGHNIVTFAFLVFLPSLFWSFSCLHVCMFACACRPQDSLLRVPPSRGTLSVSHRHMYPLNPSPLLSTPSPKQPASDKETEIAEHWSLYIRCNVVDINGPTALQEWWQSRAPSPFQERVLFLITQPTSGGDVERFFSQCGTVSKRQHKLDDNIRRLRFMLQFHGDIEGRLL